VETEKIYCWHRVLYGVKRNTAAKEAHFWDCCSNVGHFLCGVARVKRYVNVYLHLYSQQPEMDNQNVDFAYLGKIFADAHACVVCVYNLTSALYFAIKPFLCYSSTFCSSLSVSVSLNVRFTTNGVCSKTYNHIFLFFFNLFVSEQTRSP